MWPKNMPKFTCLLLILIWITAGNCLSFACLHWYINANMQVYNLSIPNGRQQDAIAIVLIVIDENWQQLQ